MENPDNLKGSFSEEQALELYHEMHRQGNFKDFVTKYMYNEDYRIVRNVFWAVTKSTEAEVLELQPIMEQLVELAMGTDNPSVRRLVLHAVERLKMKEEDMRVDFLDFCLDHMADVEEYPGIQTLCMKLAHRMCSFYPELEREFTVTLENMQIEYYKPAVKALRSKLLKSKKNGPFAKE